MHRFLLLSSSLFLLLTSACSSTLPKGISPVGDFDAERYLGTWYEIARLDHKFERGLEAVAATYSKNDDGSLRVINQGWEVDEGAWDVARGKARFAENTNTGWLEVSFFGPFYGTYAIFELDEAYSQAFVAGSDRDYLWFLSRTPQVSPEALENFRDRATDLGFDLSELILVDHTLPTVPRPEL